MNNLTLSEIANLIALKVHISNEESEAFVNKLFEIIFESLSIDESIKINNFGTFKLTKIQLNPNDRTYNNKEIHSEYNVSFISDPVLSNLVNKPFAQFEKTLLAEGIDLDLPMQTDFERDIELLEKEDLVISELHKVNDEEKAKLIDNKILNSVTPVKNKSEGKSCNKKKLPKWSIILGAAAVIGFFTYLLIDDSSD